MTETSRYLAILAKVMQNISLSESDNREKYNKLYIMIHTKLNNQLQKSIYPYTADIIQKTEKMMDAIESLYIFPEIINKKSLLISSYITTDIFDIFKDLFADKEYISLFENTSTQIPIIIFDNEGESLIEVINYANVRVKLTIEELKFLIAESSKRKIALNKIIKFIILKTKLSEPQLCIIADNIYSDAEDMLRRSISCKVAYIDKEGVANLHKRNLYGFNALLTDENNIISLNNNPKYKRYLNLNLDEINNYIKNNAVPVLYGFTDEYLSIETQIVYYYENQLLQSENMQKEITSDIVRLEDKSDITLQSIRTFEENRLKKLKSESKSIRNALKDIETLVSEIAEELNDNIITSKKILRYIMDDIFESFFKCRNFKSDLGEKIRSRLYSLEYDNMELIDAYIQSTSGKNIKYNTIEINTDEWEKAKMLLNISNPDEIPKTALKSYLKILGKHCDNGKELYAKSLIAPVEEKRKLLHESFAKGYEFASQKLIDMYKNGDHTVNLISLANALVPEACVILAEQYMSKYKSNRPYNNISDRKFTYYKIAASKQYLPAIGKIVDVVFESRFSKGFQIPSKYINEEKYIGMKINGHKLCQLCQFLISKMYMVDHYSEVLGIVMFCLNEDLSGAMSLLSNSDSALAYYCKGNMYEFGGGVSIDLDKAIDNYEKAISKGLTGKVEQILVGCRNKKAKKEWKDTTSIDSYQPTYDYVGSSYEDDSCFAPGTRILMADNTYRKVEDIRIGDNVIVFDHYNGVLSTEKIVANVHDISVKKIFDVIHLFFENGTKLDIVKSHALFDITDNKYAWLDTNNIKNYIGHIFASFLHNKIIGNKLIDYSIESKATEYYVPLSKFHLNVFAENILTMPPTKLTVNMFNIDENMIYDLSQIDICGITSYDEISSIITNEEYNELPCKYYKAVMLNNNFTVNDFEYVISLYREQNKYIKS